MLSFTKLPLSRPGRARRSVMSRVQSIAVLAPAAGFEQFLLQGPDCSGKLIHPLGTGGRRRRGGGWMPQIGHLGSGRGEGAGRQQRKERLE